MRYVFIVLGLVAIILGVTVRYNWALILSGGSFLTAGISRKEQHRPNWSRPTSLTR